MNETIYEYATVYFCKDLSGEPYSGPHKGTVHLFEHPLEGFPYPMWYGTVDLACDFATVEQDAEAAGVPDCKYNCGRMCLPIRLELGDRVGLARIFSRGHPTNGQPHLKIAFQQWMPLQKAEEACRN